MPVGGFGWVAAGRKGAAADFHRVRCQPPGQCQAGKIQSFGAFPTQIHPVMRPHDAGLRGLRGEKTAVRIQHRLALYGNAVEWIDIMSLNESAGRFHYDYPAAKLSFEHEVQVPSCIAGEVLLGKTAKQWRTYAVDRDTLAVNGLNAHVAHGVVHIVAIHLNRVGNVEPRRVRSLYHGNPVSLGLSEVPAAVVEYQVFFRRHCAQE